MSIPTKNDGSYPNELSIAVVVPLYNTERFIEKALASALEQTRRAHQIIVTDDGSTDQGPSIVQSLANNYPEITLIKMAKGNASSARNEAVRATKCDLIAFLDADDVWYADHLEVLARPFETLSHHKLLGWVYSDVDVIDKNGLVLNHRGLKQHASQHPKRDILDCLRYAMFVFPSATIVSRAAFDAVGGFDERLSAYEDDDFFLRVLSAGFTNVYVDRCLVQYRDLAGSSSKSIRMTRARIGYIKQLLNEYGQGGVSRNLTNCQAIARRFLPELGGDLRRAIEESSKERRNLSHAGFRLLWPYYDMKAKIQIFLGVSLSYMPNVIAKPAFALRHRLWEKARPTYGAKPSLGS
jgi:glycosyltransferase involved in cell wall biosynthesis